MRPLPRPGLAGLALAVALSSAPAAAKDVTPPRVVFLAPADGAEAARADEVWFGAEVGANGTLAGEAPDAPRFRLERAALPADDKALGKLLKAWKKEPPLLAVGWLPGERTRGVEDAFAKAGVPLLVLSPEATRPDLDRDRAVLWAGGASAQDEALQAMDYLMQPLGSRRPAILHDGSPRALACVAATGFFRHVAQEPLAPAVVGNGFGAADVAAAASVDADGILYFGGPEGAERLLAAHREAESDLPVLLGDGLVSAAVPTFAEGRGNNVWALAHSYFEDRGRLGTEDRYPLVDAAKAAGRGVLPGMAHGQRALLWVRQALAAAEGDPDRLVAALRALDRPGAAGKPVFEIYGHASLARFALWKSEASEREKLPACHERPSTRVPIQGVPHVGFFSAKKFEYEPGTHHVWVRWRDDDKRSIEEDLLAIGLSTQGYEEDLEARVLDDLLGRVLSKMNRLFLRNPDGTAIPGVSFNVSFSAEPFPDDVKGGRKWDALIGGDDPDAGGRAAGNTAWIFSTFIRRTMYVEHKLVPPLSIADRPHMMGGYAWDTSAADNIRNGMVRSLVDGFSQAMALTGAHELGHLGGCGHDTEFPRSIMNVQEGAGLEFEWAEWTPSHTKLLEKRLKRAAAR